MYKRVPIVAASLVLLLAGCGSSVAESKTMPDLTEMTLDEAKEILDSNEIAVDEIDSGNRGNPEGDWIVTRQIPASGREISSDGAVDLVVRSPESIKEAESRANEATASQEAKAAEAQARRDALKAAEEKAQKEMETKLTSRGTLPLALGESAEVHVDGKFLASLTVDSVEVDPACTGSYIRPPENGHFVVMNATVETGDFNDFTDLGYVPTISMRTGGFKLVTDSGKVVEGNNLIGSTYGCFPDSEMMPNDVGLGENASGKLMFDVPVPEGVIVLPDLGVQPSDITGWEWRFPQ